MTVHRTRAQAVLSTVFIIGAIVAVVATTLAFLAGSFVNSSYGARAAEQALEVASSGVRDGMLQIVRRGDISLATYIVPIGTYAASVTLSKDTPSQNQVTIISSATVAGHTRKIQAVVSINPVTGQAVVVSWQELTL